MPNNNRRKIPKFPDAELAKPPTTYDAQSRAADERRQQFTVRIDPSIEAAN